MCTLLVGLNDIALVSGYVDAVQACPKSLSGDGVRGMHGVNGCIVQF